MVDKFKNQDKEDRQGYGMMSKGFAFGGMLSSLRGSGSWQRSKKLPFAGMIRHDRVKDKGKQSRERDIIPSFSLNKEEKVAQTCSYFLPITTESWGGQ